MKSRWTQAATTIAAACALAIGLSAGRPSAQAREPGTEPDWGDWQHGLPVDLSRMLYYDQLMPQLA